MPSCRGGGVDVGLLGKKSWVSGKMNGPSEEWVGGRRVAAKVCLGVGWTSGPLSWDGGHSSLTAETCLAFITTEFTLDDFSCQRRWVQRRPLPALAGFQVPTAQTNKHPNRVSWGGLFWQKPPLAQFAVLLMRLKPWQQPPSLAGWQGPWLGPEL